MASREKQYFCHVILQKLNVELLNYSVPYFQGHVHIFPWQTRIPFCKRGNNAKQQSVHHFLLKCCYSIAFGFFLQVYLLANSNGRLGIEM